MDDDDYEKLKQYSWYAVIKGKDTKTLYACRCFHSGGKSNQIYLHREVMKNPEGLEVDHINHNGLDNRKENLRICTHQENLFNKSKQRYGSSKYKGVSFCKYNNKWIARISDNGKYRHIGQYFSEIEAANAYNNAAIQRDSVYCFLNGIDKEELEKEIKNSKGRISSKGGA